MRSTTLASFLAPLALFSAPLAHAKEVLAHYMVAQGYATMADPSQWTFEFNAAKQMNIDGFVLNFWETTCGDGDHFGDIIDGAFKAAEAQGFKLMLSFDTNWYQAECEHWTAASMYARIKDHLGSPAMVTFGSDNAIVLSSFDINTADASIWPRLKSDIEAAGYKAVWAPCISTAYTGPILQSLMAENPWIEGFCNWNTFPAQGKEQNATDWVNGLDTDLRALVPSSAPYIMGTAAWQFKAMNGSVEGANGWITYGDYLLPQRLDFLVNGGSDGSYFPADFVELLTWNDFAETSYFKSIDTIFTDTSGDYCLLDSSRQYIENHRHDGWRTLAKYYFKWWKTETKPEITMNQVIYWYRSRSHSPCDNQVIGADNLVDQVVAYALVKDDVTIEISFDNGAYGSSTFSVKGGSTDLKEVMFAVPITGNNVRPIIKITPTKSGSATTCTGPVEFQSGGSCSVSGGTANLNAVVGLCGGGVNTGYPALPAATAY